MSSFFLRVLKTLRPEPRPPRGGAGVVPYAGDYQGKLRLRYAPRSARRAHAGSLVWAWVPFAEDPAHGKKRPVLLVGRRRGWMLALMLTSKDHATSTHGGSGRMKERYLELGSGAWDRRQRSSSVRLDRVIRLAPGAVPQQRVLLGRRRFRGVARAFARLRRDERAHQGR